MHAHVHRHRNKHTHTHTAIHINYHLSNAGFPPWYCFWVMNGAGKVQNPNSFGCDLFSFPLITKKLLTDSQHSQHSHNVFIAFQTCRQTGWEKRGGKKWEREGKNGKERVGEECAEGLEFLSLSLYSLLSNSQGQLEFDCFGLIFYQKIRNPWMKREIHGSENEWVRVCQHHKPPNSP